MGTCRWGNMRSHKWLQVQTEQKLQVHKLGGWKRQEHQQGYPGKLRWPLPWWGVFPVLSGLFLLGRNAVVDVEFVFTCEEKSPVWGRDLSLGSGLLGRLEWWRPPLGRGDPGAGRAGARPGNPTLPRRSQRGLGAQQVQRSVHGAQVRDKEQIKLVACGSFE